MDLREFVDDHVIAALRENPSLAKEYIEDAENGSDGRITLLWQASSLNRSKIVRQVLECSCCEVNFQRRSDGVSCLYVAAQNGHIDICRALLHAGANVDLARNTKASPLFIATQQNNLDIMRLLLQHGAHVDSQNEQGCSPYVLACYLGFADAALMLLDAGADWWQSGTGRTGYSWAKIGSSTETRASLHSFVVNRLHLKWSKQMLSRHMKKWVCYRAQEIGRRLEVVALEQAAQRNRKAVLESALLGGPLPQLSELIGSVDGKWLLTPVTLKKASDLDVTLASTAKRRLVAKEITQEGNEPCCSENLHIGSVCSSVCDTLTQISHSPDRRRM